MSLEVPVLWLVLSHQMVVVTANVSIKCEEMWRFVNFLFSLRRGVGGGKRLLRLWSVLTWFNEKYGASGRAPCGNTLVSFGGYNVC